MKRTAIALMFFALAAAAFGQGWFPGSFDEAQAKAKAEGKLVLINFFSGG